MSSTEVIKKAIIKAGKNGYHLQESTNFEWIMETYSVEEIIFDPRFGKTFFGEYDIVDLNSPGDLEPKPAWQVFFRDMVILSPEERVKYLEKYL